MNKYFSTAEIEPMTYTPDEADALGAFEEDAINPDDDTTGIIDLLIQEGVIPDSQISETEESEKEIADDD